MSKIFKLVQQKITEKCGLGSALMANLVFVLVIILLSIGKEKCLNNH
ncbi:hypothetical protein N6G96_07325 [Pediococcus inopinatus]|uniref:Uncharacterized protein n=1 Tax=Pediococcus inopinatus TaxID=114090 RepID=A0ABZ0Q2C8_9LACO|nr:hypothetical protein [Pediococcus inopinatus]WPC21099.1 hypothetical protein N6G96_07325 [Pediococcus inopinatus]